jgi:Putative zinc-finger
MGRLKPVLDEDQRKNEQFVTPAIPTVLNLNGHLTPGQDEGAVEQAPWQDGAAVEFPKCSEDQLEDYLFGRIDGPALERLEEHLLVCSRCQKGLAAIDEFVAALRVAVRRL